MEALTRLWEDLLGRVGGPMTIRLILQPAMASALAIRAGLRDARNGRAPYFWAVFSDPAQRRDLLRDGWKDAGKIFAAAIALDVVYQLVVLRRVYPLETLIVAALLAILPYLLIRGPVNRLASRRHRRAAASL